MWSLYENKEDAKNPEFLKPLVFSNGKSQENVVKEVLEAIEQGFKVIFIKGVCGTGKSAIALNLAKEVGKASVVVPIKNLQKQYEEDYTQQKFLLKDKEKKEKLKIAVMTGRSNHICRYLQENPQIAEEKIEKNSRLSDFNNLDDEGGNRDFDYFDDSFFSEDISCDNALLPCKIQIKEKNSKKINEYLRKNPRINAADFANITPSNIRRMSIAPICPYWSPIVPSEIDLGLEANKKNYEGLQGRQFTIYQRKPGCKYYEQFNAYLDADVLVFNSQKYKLETLMDRKPLTEIEIIDECDEFLDSFSNQEKINLNRLNFALGAVFPESSESREIIDRISEITRNLLKNKKIEESILNETIFPVKETKIYSLLKYFSNRNVMEDVECDEENYCYHVDEVSRVFEGFFNDTYVSFYKEERDLIVRLVTTNLEKRFKALLDKNKVLVMMSGTIHSESVLKNIFGITDFKVIEAETQMPGKISALKTGREINCKYSNFQNNNITREQYLLALDKCIEDSKKPTLVHVNAFKDLPSEQEVRQYNLNILSREKFRNLQEQDSGNMVRRFKEGEISILYSTRCNRGVDFPGKICNSIVLTRYPYPNVSSLFWRILKKTHPQYYNSFYLDKSRRELLQKVYRGLRSKQDHIFLLSPDSRIFSSF